MCQSMIMKNCIIFFNIPSLSSRITTVDNYFISALLKGTLDVPMLLSRVKFKVPTMPYETKFSFMFLITL